ncbi:MAG: calcium/proton exchanger [Patescibacteria group bacterium]|nr:calcium/proton exchanger [Patescibacteria group bacterium]
MQKLFLGLLIFVPIAIGAHFAGVSPTAVFFLSALAIIPLAKYIGEAVEELSLRTGPALGGLLSSTFGNATELIIGFFALKAGLVEVVKASLTGSIIGNLLLVLGLAMFAGGWNREKQTFNRTGVVAGGSALFIAVIALVMPAIFLQTAPLAADGIVEDLSVWVSIALLLVYCASLFFSLHTHKHLYLEEVGKYEPRWSIPRSLAVLCVSTLAVAWVSDILVGSIEPVVQNFGWSQLFVGVIFLAVIGNAAENFSAVLMARKNRMDLSLQIAIGSATQIAMVVAPLLVLAGLALSQPMNLIFNTFELVSIVLSVLIVNMMVADGESNWLEGVQLLAAYAIIGIAFFFHP